MERTAICNAALALIGQARIPDFDATGPTAQACRDAWDICRQAAIRCYHWNFALHRVALSASATVPQHGFTYAFPLPTDYLKAIQVNGLSAGTSYAEFSIENGQILTNDSTVNLWYVRDVEESSRWDAAFVEFFTYRLGAAVAPRITTSTSIAESLEARALAMLAKAKEGDADESRPHVIRGMQTSPYALARGGAALPSSSSSSSSSSSGGATTVTLSGDVTGSGTASITATIANDAVTNAKLANMAASRIKARITGTTGDPEDATLSQVLDLVGSAANGDVLIRAGGVWTRLGIGTSGQALLVSAGLPAWGTVSGSGTGDLLAANNLSELTATASTARANLGLTIGTHVQAYSATLAQVAAGTWTGAASITTLGTVTTGTWSATTIAVDKGGTGRTSHTAYAVLCGGTTSTGEQQSIASVGTAGQVLTSNGPGAMPTFQTTTGGGSWRRTVYVNAAAMIPRITAGASATTVETTTNDIMYDALAFDTTTEEGAGFWLAPPTAWDAGSLTAKFHWTAATGSGTVKWDIAARCFNDDDAMDQATGTEQTAGADTLLATGDMHISGTTPAITVAGTVTANRPVYFQITRDTGGDTLTADALLLGVTIEYTEISSAPSAQ